MSVFFRAIRDRQQHMGYFVICFLLFGLALALVQPANWWVVIALWIALVGLLELVYRWTIALVRRNRRTWWARPRGHSFWRAQRSSMFLGIAAMALMFRHPFLRYAFLALLIAGLFCAGIIHWVGRHDQG